MTCQDVGKAAAHLKMHDRGVRFKHLGKRRWKIDLDHLGASVSQDLCAASKRILNMRISSVPFKSFAKPNGELMVHGGIVNRIIAFANTLVGSIRGGLGHVTIFTGLGLASVSGTAVADAAALGSALLRPMEKLYGRAFSTSLIAATANLGPIQPPSTAMIVYASIAGPGVAVGALFIAGVVPALLIVTFMVA